jgi:hypothetical protein
MNHKCITVREARRLASRGYRSSLLDKIANATKARASMDSATNDRVAVPVAGCEVFDQQPRAEVSADFVRIIQKIPLTGLVAAVGRSVDRKNVAILAQSFRETGQTAAILVFREEQGVFRIISGHDRVEAARDLGWLQIDAVILATDERSQRLVEIAENLHRRELTVLERAKLVDAWIKLVRNEAAQVERPLGGRQPNDRGLSKVATSLGVSRAEATRSALIASMPQGAMKKAIELDLQDNQAALLRVAKLPTPDLQIAQLHEIAERKKIPRSNGGALGAPSTQRGAGRGSPAPSVQQLQPEQDLPIPEALDRRDVDKEFGRLKLSWRDFRRALQNAPLAVRRRFIRDVLLSDGLIRQDAADRFDPKPAIIGEQGRAT